MDNSGKNTFKRTTIAFFLVLFAFTSGVDAQVSIAPTSLFFSDHDRFSSLIVSNGSDTAQEVSISTEFGYPTSRNGNLVIAGDSSLAEQKSMAEWIKIFPGSFTLQAGQRQVVRFVARPPADLEDGGYWTRVSIASSPVSTPVGTPGSEQIGAQINVIVNQVISAHYRTGAATTGVSITSVTFQQNEDTGRISIGMKQEGNAPFIGTIGFSIEDKSGNKIYRTHTTNSVYTTITRTFTVDISGVEPGAYVIRGSVTSDRRDIARDNLLQIEPISFQKKIIIK